MNAPLTLRWTLVCASGDVAKPTRHAFMSLRILSCAFGFGVTDSVASSTCSAFDVSSNGKIR